MVTSVALTKDTLTQIIQAGSGASDQLIIVSLIAQGGTFGSTIGLYLDTETTTPFTAIPVLAGTTIGIYPQLLLTTSQKISAKSSDTGTMITVSTVSK